MINRSAVLVRPAQPFIDWALTLDDSGLAPATSGEAALYLIPEYQDEVEALELLAEAFDIIFDCELEGWHTDESAWPRNRTFAMFRDWFTFEFHSLVEDLCGYPLENDAEDPIPSLN